MKFLFLFALVFIACLSSAVAGTCDANKKEKDCLATSEDGEKCSWCTSAAVGSTCFKESDAKSLPSSIYSCKYQAAYSAEGTTCDTNKKEKDCLAAKEGSSKCSWCSSAAVGSTCFKEEDAKSLPSSIYSCKYQAAYSAEGTTCDVNKKEKECLAAKEGDEKCSWCKSAAVGATCFKESDAKSLPSSVYACEYQKAYSAAGTTCDTNKKEKDCLASKEDGEKCSWCSSAAVGSTCFKESDAKSLPSSIYSCKYQAAYSAEGTTCDTNKKQKDCLAAKEGSSKCAWCSSAAVGSTCFMEEDAKSLPSSIYSCEYQKAYFRGSA